MKNCTFSLHDVIDAAFAFGYRGLADVEGSIQQDREEEAWVHKTTRLWDPGRKAGQCQLHRKPPQARCT